MLFLEVLEQKFLRLERGRKHDAIALGISPVLKIGGCLGVARSAAPGDHLVDLVQTRLQRRRLVLSVRWRLTAHTGSSLLQVTANDAKQVDSAVVSLFVAFRSAK